MTEMLIYMTAGDAGEATRIGRALVEERLAACANVLPGMTPIFWWDGEVQEGSEAVLIAKTTAELVEPLVERVRDLHSYDCPCVVALPIGAGNPEFLDWIRGETRPAPPG